MGEDLMSYWYIVLPIAAAIAFAVWWTKFRTKNETGPVNTTAPGIVLPREWTGGQYLRPDGGWVLSVHPIPAEKREEVLGAISAGLEQACRSMKHHNPTWTRAMTAAEVPPVLLIEPMAQNMDGSPALLVGGHKSAGTVINVFSDLVERGEPMIVLPDQGAPEYNWSHIPYAKAGSRHEWEHGGEWKNNKAVFLQFIGPNDIHPHWSDPEGEQIIFGISSLSICSCETLLGEAGDAYVLEF